MKEKWGDDNDMDWLPSANEAIHFEQDLLNICSEKQNEPIHKKPQ